VEECFARALELLRTAADAGADAGTEDPGLATEAVDKEDGGTLTCHSA
jgi:hypothetical protein